MEWQPIETAPKDGTPIIVCDNYWSDSQGEMREAHFGRWNSNRDLWEACWFHEYAFGIRPTHWMPLPPLPATK